MSKVCDCNVGLSNTGRPGCVPIQGVTSSLILVPLKDNDGNRNGIDLSVPLNAAFFSALVNQLDASKRWFPLPAFEEVDQPKAESLKKEFASGRSIKLRDGKRSFTGWIVGDDASPTFLGKLEDAGCVDFGFYSVDVNGNLIGDFDKALDFLFPIPADNQSWDPRLMLATDGEVNHILLEFDWKLNFSERNMKMLKVAEAGQDFTELEGLIDVLFDNVVASAATQTIVFDAEFEYGTAPNADKYKGATNITDWIVDDPLGVPLVILTSVENTSGNYTITLAAASFIATDVLDVQVSRDGFSGSTSVIAGA